MKLSSGQLSNKSKHANLGQPLIFNRKDLEEGEIIDDDCRIVEVIPSEPIIIPDKKRGKRRGKKGNKPSNQKSNKFSKVQKRQVTMKQAYQTMHNLKEKGQFLMKLTTYRV